MEISLKMGVDPKHADQMVRGTVVLPHGTGKDKKVLVIASGDKIKEAEEAVRSSEEKFRNIFKDSPIKRTKYKGLIRNIGFVQS